MTNGAGRRKAQDAELHWLPRIFVLSRLFWVFGVLRLLRRSPGSGGGMLLWFLLVFMLIRIWVFVLHRLLGAVVFRIER